MSGLTPSPTGEVQLIWPAHFNTALGLAPISKGCQHSSYSTKPTFVRASSKWSPTISNYAGMTVRVQCKDGEGGGKKNKPRENNDKRFSTTCSRLLRSQITRAYVQLLVEPIPGPQFARYLHWFGRLLSFELTFVQSPDWTDIYYLWPYIPQLPHESPCPDRDDWQLNLFTQRLSLKIISCNIRQSTAEW